MARYLALALLLALAACGENPDRAYERGFNEGYDAGQYDVCQELDRRYSNISDQLRNCVGF